MGTAPPQMGVPDLNRDGVSSDDIVSRHRTLGGARRAFRRLSDMQSRYAYIARRKPDGSLPARVDATWREDLARDD